MRDTRRAREAGPPDPARTDEHTHARTGPGRGVLRPARGGEGVHTKTAPVHRRSPPLNDGRYGKPDASVTGSTHANHRSARSPRPTPEEPARDKPIAGPRTGTTRCEPSAPASAWASGRHNEPGSRLDSACPEQPPSKAGGASPRGGERHHSIGKANRSTESDRTGRGAAHHAGPPGSPERHAAGYNQGTRTGAKQQRPPGAADGGSEHNTQRTTGPVQVPDNTKPAHHKPQPGVAGYKRGAHTGTHTPRRPSQEWRGATETRAEAHTSTPRTPVRNGGLQAKRAQKHPQTPTSQP